MSLRPLIAGPLFCPNCRRMVSARHWYRSGKTRCNNRRTWTTARLWRLMELIERGWDDERIARTLGTTATGVQLARKRHGVPSRTETLLSSLAVADVLGIGCPKTVVAWITAGWLAGRRGQRRGGNRQWLVTREALLRFLENADHWHRWHPERITDPTIQHFAQDMRGGIRFLTLPEVANLHCVQSQTVYAWIEKGWLPAVRNGNHLVREDVARAFRRPSEERRDGVIATIETLRRRGLTIAAIATLLGDRSKRSYVAELGAGRREPLRSTTERFTVLLEETAHLPEGDRPAFGQRRPIAGFDALNARVRARLTATTDDAIEVAA